MFESLLEVCYFELKEDSIDSPFDFFGDPQFKSPILGLIESNILGNI